MSNEELNRELGQVPDAPSEADAITPKEAPAHGADTSEELQAYRALVDNMQDGAFIIQDAKFQFVNRALARIIGFSRQEIVGQDFLALVAPEDQGLVADRYRRRLAGEDIPSEYQLRMVHKDGSYVRANITVTMGEYQGQAASIGTVKDVTTWQDTQEQLQQSQQKLAFHVQQTPLAIIEWNLDFEVVDWNPAAERIFGYSRDEALGRHAAGLIVPESVKEIVDQVWQDLLAQKGGTRSTNENTTKDGQIITCEWYNTPLVDQDGNVLGVASLVQDITQEKLAQEELQKLASVVQYSSEIINLATPDGNMVFLNEAGSKILGIDPEEVEGVNIMQVIPEYWLDTVQTELLPAITEKGTWEGDLQYRNLKTGELTDVHAMTFTIRDPDTGAPLFLANVSLDITERKQLEQQIQESLARRTQEVQISTEVAQEIAGAPALDELYQRVVTLVKERFGYYHTQIFRHDPEQDAMVVVVGYGEAGEAMKAAGHSLPYGQGVVGTAAASGEPVLASDTAEDPNWVPHPNLPDTRGELAVPIKLQDKVLGVLDVQSDTAGALTEEDQVVLLGLAGQIASAIESTQALEQADTFRQFVDASGQGFGMAALDGSIVYANPVLTRMLGADTPEALYGQNIASFYPPELVQRLQEEALPAVMAEGEWTGELPLVSPEGELTPTIQSIFLIRNNKGEPLYLANVIVDITERERIDAEREQLLTQTGMLYEAGRRLNEAQDVEQIVAAVTESVPVPGINRAVLVAFDRDENDEVEAMTVTANWHSGSGTLPTPVGTRYPREVFETVGVLLSPEPLFLDDALHDERIVDSVTMNVLERQNILSMVVLPLWAGTRQLGALLLEGEEPRHFTEMERDAYIALAGQVAVAINARNLLQQIQEALDQTEALYAGSGQVVRTTSVDQVLQALVDSTALQHLDRASIAFFDRPWQDEMPDEAIIMAAWERSGQESQAPVGMRYPLGQFPAIDTADPDNPTLFRDVMTDERVDDTMRTILVERLGMRSLGLWPLVAGGQWLGLVTGQASSPMEMGESAERQIASLVEQAAAVIQSQRLREQAQRRAVWLQTAAEVSRTTSTVLDPGELIQQVVDLVRDRFDLYYAGLFLVEQNGDGASEGKWAVLRVGTGEAGRQMVEQGHRLEIGGESMIGQSLATARPRIAMDVGDEAVRFENPLLPDTHTELALPLISRGQALGALTIQSDQVAAFSEDDIAVLQTMADQLATTIDNANLIEQAQSRAAQERLLSDATARMRETLDVDTVLRVAAQEMRQVLGLHDITIQLGSTSRPGKGAAIGDPGQVDDTKTA